MIGVGDKVVCVSENPGWARLRQVWNAPFIGSVYTVRDIGWSYRADMQGPAIRLEEVCNPIVEKWGAEPNFGLWRFRPVKKTKTDISIFQEIDREVFSRAPAGAPWGVDA